MKGAASSLMSLRYKAVGTHGFPSRNAQVPAELVAFRERMQLMPDKFTKRLLARHALRLLCMSELALGQGVNSRAQDFTVEAVLASKVVIDAARRDAVRLHARPTPAFRTAAR